MNRFLKGALIFAVTVVVATPVPVPAAADPPPAVPDSKPPATLEGTASPTASPSPGVTVMTLARENQPRIERPTLDRIRSEARRQGVPFETALTTYATDMARQNPQAQADLPDGPVPDPTISIDGLPFAELIDLKRLAESKGITFEESIDRYAWTPMINKVAAKLAADFPADLSGVAIVNDGRSVRIGFTGAVPEQALRLAQTIPAEVTLIADKGFSESELKATMQARHAVLAQRPEVAATEAGYDAETGVITFRVKPRWRIVDDAGKRQVMEDIQPAAPGNPRIRLDVQLDSQAGPEFVDNYLRGGGLLNGSYNCTNGFNIINSSTYERGSATARHCADQVVYYTYKNHPDYNTKTTTITRWFRAEEYDLARYVGGGMTYTRTFYYAWNRPRYAKDVGTSPVKGQPVCKFGRTTGATCNEIVDSNQEFSVGGKLYRGNIRTDIRTASGDPMTAPGDSGGPLYYGNRAWGITSAGNADHGDTRSWFVAMDRLNDSGGMGGRWNVWTCPSC